MKDVVVLDYGSGNLHSAERALARTGARVTVTDDPRHALRCDGLVVPGVGAFAACMASLVAASGDDVIKARLTAGRPVLGICVGMQVLFDLGDERGVRSEGLGVLPGAVLPLDAPVLPHMGWNTVVVPPESVLMADVEDDERFYFVHSYAAPAVVLGAVVSTATHGSSTFAAVVEAGALTATQFHPEKSGDAGARLLSTWIETL